MIRLLWACLLLSGRIRAHLAACPSGWVSGGASCYRASLSLAAFPAASAACVAQGARLAALSSPQEAARLGSVLGPRAESWLLGAARRGSVLEWEAEGPLAFATWETTKEPLLDHVALHRNGDEWLWRSINASAKLPFVCEVSKMRLNDVWERSRSAAEWGLSGAQVRARLAAPRVLRQPSSLTYFGAAGPQPSAVLACRVDGNPRPRLTWYRGSAGTKVRLNSSPRLLAIGGRLVFRSVAETDADSYYCVASNRFGTVRSLDASIRFAYMREFPPSRLDVYATEGLGQSLQCQEPDHFPRNLGYGWMVGSVGSFVEESARVFISRDGGLYLAALEAADAAAYACNIVQHELQSGSYGPFFHLHVQPPPPGVATAFAPKIPEVFPKLFPEIPEIGAPVRLECFAFARPAASYTWELVGGELPSTAVLDNLNRTLSIPSLSAAAAGLYRCTAENSQGTDSRQLTLEAHGGPVLTREGLEGVGVEGEGERVQLRCPVYPPGVEVEWFRDGRPLSPLLMPKEVPQIIRISAALIVALKDAERISLKGRELTLSPVLRADRGVYQCIARNDLGAVTASAYLPVPDPRPTADKVASRTVLRLGPAAALSLPCEVEAGASARLSWAKDGTPLPSATLSDDGALLLASLRTEDGGAYRCSASDSLGTADAALIHLSVAEPLTLFVRPQRRRLPKGRPLTLTCTLEGNRCTPNHGCVSASFSWELNGQAVSAGAGIVQTDADGKTSVLSVVAIRRSHAGVFVCRADSALGHLSATADIQVISEPPPPANVKVGSVASTSVVLSWKMLSTPSGPFPFNKFRVEATFNYSANNWTVVHTMSSSAPIVSEERISNLLPASTYRFRVSAHNDVGWGAASPPTSAVTTHAGPPAAAVSALQLIRPSPGLLLLAWEPLPSSLWGAPNLGYILEWEEEGLGPKSVALGDPTADRYAVPTDALRRTHCPPLAFRLSVFNSEGRGPTAELPMEPIPLHDPSRAGEDFVAQALNSTHAQLQWAYAFNVSGCEPTVAFKVSCASRDGAAVDELYPARLPMSVVANSTSLGNSTLETALFNVTFGPLLPDTLFSCALVPLTADGRPGPPVAANAFTTRRSAPLHWPENVRVKESWDAPESAAEIAWWTLDTGSKEEPLTGYQIRVRRDGLSHSESLWVSAGGVSESSSPLVRLDGLRPLELVHISVAGFSSGGLGPESPAVPHRIGAPPLRPPPTRRVSAAPTAVPPLLLLVLLAGLA